MAVSTASFSFLDHSGEQSNVSVTMPVTTSGNIGTQEAAVALGGALFDTIDALSLCTLASSALTVAKVQNSSAVPGSAYAQRETGLLVTYEDTTSHKKFRLTIPGPDWATLGQEGTDMINPTALAWTNFITAFEAAAVSPDGGAVNVISGRLVGRNR